MEFVEFLSVAGTSTLKILPALAIAIGLKFSALEIFLSTFIGGMIGVIIFSYFGTAIRNWRKNRMRKKIRKKPMNIKRARKMLRMWNKFGLPGIAILTPPMISPPIGAIIASAFGAEFKKTVLYMAISMAVWSLLFALIGETILTFVHELSDKTSVF